MKKQGKFISEFGDITLLIRLKANWASFEFAAQNWPIQGWLGRTAVEYIFFKKYLWIFNAYFLKWMLNSRFLTSITYDLTPRTSNLMRFEAWSFKHGFSTASVASVHRGRRSKFSSRHQQQKWIENMSSKIFLKSINKKNSNFLKIYILRM